MHDINASASQVSLTIPLGGIEFEPRQDSAGALTSLVIRKIRAMPRVLYYMVRSHGRRNYIGQWNSYWSSVQETGEHGEVLWDSDDQLEFEEAMSRFAPHADRSIPVLDLGCGNGRWSRYLSSRFDRVIGVDISDVAIERARAESVGFSNIQYRVGNLVDPKVAAALHDEFGDVNILMRGVFHVIRNADRPGFVSSLETLMGSRGVLHQIETDGEVLDYMLARPDNTKTGLPRPMHKVVEHGILPQGFGPDDQRRWLPSDRWEILQSCESSIRTIELPDGQTGRVPAYALTARPRPTH